MLMTHCDFEMPLQARKLHSGIHKGLIGELVGGKEYTRKSCESSDETGVAYTLPTERLPLLQVT